MKRIVFGAAFAVLALSPVIQAAQHKDMTVAQALDPNFFAAQVPREVTWAPDGRSFYFLLPGPPGAPSDLLACDAATLERRTVLSQAAFREAYGRLGLGLKPDALTKAAFDRYLLSPAGHFLLLPVGGGAVVWDVQKRTMSRLLPPGREPENMAWSPDERSVAFTSGGNLYVADRTTGREVLVAEGKKPLVTCGSVDWLYGEELDMTTGFWWSPDSARLAYLRFDEAGVPTYPIVDQSQLAPGVRPQFYPKAGDPNPEVTLHVVASDGTADSAVPGADSGQGYLPRVEWLPGGGGLVFELVDRNQVHLVLRRWDLGGAEAARVLEETSPTWVNVMEAPRFLKDGRFLWRSERDGFAHLYLMDLKGGAPVRLTKGAWVVDGIAGVDEAKGWVYFTCNRDEAIGAQLYRVDLKGRRLEAVSRGEGWHEVTMAPGAERYLDSYSRGGVPEVLSLVDAKGGRSRVVADGASPELAEYGFVKPEYLTLTAPDGTVLHAEVVMPRDFDPAKKYPALVEVYGGPHLQLVQDRWIGRWAAIDQLFAQAGIVCFSVDNRGSDRRGKAFEDVLLRRTGKAELADQLAGLAALKALPYVDGSRVGLWGWSYGGFMTCYALTHAPAGAYACGAAVAPVTDWLNYDTCYTERYLKLPKDNPEGYKDSSPVHVAAKLSVPFFLAQGLVDDNVHFGNSVQLVDALYAAHRSFEMAYYPRMDHGIRGPDARRDLFTRLVGFFRMHLGAAR